MQVLAVQMINGTTVHIHFYTIYLFIYNAIKMQEAHIYSFWYGSFP